VLRGSTGVRTGGRWCSTAGGWPGLADSSVTVLNVAIGEWLNQGDEDRTIFDIIFEKLAAGGQQG
jgi:hypothetical protein